MAVSDLHRSTSMLTLLYANTVKAIFSTVESSPGFSGIEGKIKLIFSPILGNSGWGDLSF